MSRGKAWWAVVGLCVGALGAACSSSTGTSQGGEARFDAGPPQMPTPPAPPAPEGGTSDGGVPTFTDIYRDLIGPPPAKGSCTFGSSCHGAVGQGGTTVSGGYVCPKPASASAADLVKARTECYDSLKTSPAGMLQGTDAKQTRLYTILRKADGTPSSGAPMPLQPSTVTFTADDLKRIEDWFNAGAKND